MADGGTAWGELGRSLAKGGLTLLGGALAGPAGAGIGGLVGKALGLGDAATPAQVQTAVDRDPQGTMAALRRAEADHAQEMARAMLAIEATSLKETGATYRAELAQDDLYTKRARPTLIYFLALACMVMIGTACATVFLAPGQLPALGGLYDALSWPLIVLGSGAGVYIRSRSSHDKVLAHGHPPPAGGLLQAIADRVRP